MTGQLFSALTTTSRDDENQIINWMFDAYQTAGSTVTHTWNGSKVPPGWPGYQEDTALWGTYAFEICVYEYDNSSSTEPIDYFYLRWPYCLSIAEDEHDTWTKTTVEGEELRCNYRLRDVADFNNYSIKENPLSMSMVAIDGFMNELGFEESVQDATELNVLHNGVSGDGIVAYTNDDQFIGTPRVIYVAEDACWIAYRRDHQPSRMLTVNRERKAYIAGKLMKVARDVGHHLVPWNIFTDANLSFSYEVADFFNNQSVTGKIGNLAAINHPEYDNEVRFLIKEMEKSLGKTTQQWTKTEAQALVRAIMRSTQIEISQINKYLVIEGRVKLMSKLSWIRLLQAMGLNSASSQQVVNQVCRDAGVEMINSADMLAKVANRQFNVACLDNSLNAAERELIEKATATAVKAVAEKVAWKTAIRGTIMIVGTFVVVVDVAMMLNDSATGVNSYGIVPTEKREWHNYIPGYGGPGSLNYMSPNEFLDIWPKIIAFDRSHELRHAPTTGDLIMYRYTYPDNKLIPEAGDDCFFTTDYFKPPAGIRVFVWLIKEGRSVIIGKAGSGPESGVYAGRPLVYVASKDFHVVHQYEIKQQ